MLRPTFDEIDDLAMELAAGVTLLANEYMTPGLRAALEADPATRRMWQSTLDNANRLWDLYMHEVMAPLPGLEEVR